MENEFHAMIIESSLEPNFIQNLRKAVRYGR
jgi:hypothetical protein